MCADDLQAVHALLTEKPRPQGWLQRRKRLDEVASTWPATGDVAHAAVDVDGIPGEWSIASGSRVDRALLFFHGGGYCSGSIRSHRSLVTAAGCAGRLRTLSVEYRLAPEHPFPAAFDDALAAWRFLRNSGLPAHHIAVGGDSAGGGLTVALMNRLQGMGEALPACIWLISPWTDLTMSGGTL